MLILLILVALIALIIFICMNALTIYVVITGATMLYLFMFPAKKGHRY